MRKILFKGKRKNDGGNQNRWCEGYYYKDCVSDKHIIHLKGLEKDGLGFIHGYEIIPETLCEFIGTIDKVDLYENDIVSFSFYEHKGDKPASEDLKQTIYAVVKYSEENHKFMFYEEDLYEYDLNDFPFDKVEGNIFDTPELLTKKEQSE